MRRTTDSSERSALRASRLGGRFCYPRVTVFDLVNNQWKNHTNPHNPHVHTVRIRCMECAVPPTFRRVTCFRFCRPLSAGTGTYTTCGCGGGGGIGPVYGC